MGIYTLLTLGTTVVGGPLVGWVCGQWSPRTGLAFAGVATAVAALVMAAPRGLLPLTTRPDREHLAPAATLTPVQP